MKKLILAAALAMSAVSANAALLTFDDIAGQAQNGVGDMAVYKGFTFNSTLDWLDLVDSPWNFGAVSGQFGILNNYGGFGEIKKADGKLFTFDGLWAQNWARGAARTAVVTGYKNGREIWSQSKVINGTSYTEFGPMAGKIDTLRFSNNSIFLLDNVALNHPAKKVPEPASLALMGLALAGLVAARRKKS